MFSAALGIEIDHAIGIARADRDLVHVSVGRMQQRAFFGDRHDCQRIRQRLRRQRRAFQRIERDVDGVPPAPTFSPI